MTAPHSLKRSTPLVVRNVTKTFGNGISWPWRRTPQRCIRAVQDVSFTIKRREVFGLIGANGSGKSTLIRMLSGLVVADAGTIEIFGYDVERDSMAARQLINRVSADPTFFRQMSALENLMFFGRVYGLKPKDIAEQSETILERLNLDAGQRRQMVKELSRGQQQKIAVARAFLTSPSLMLLDEPTTGLDPRSKRDVQTFVREVQRDHDTTILLTTHDMDEAEALCDRIAFIVGGRIIAEGTADELRALTGARTMDDVFMALTGRSVEEDEEEVVA